VTSRRWMPCSRTSRSRRCRRCTRCPERSAPGAAAARGDARRELVCMGEQDAPELLDALGREAELHAGEAERPLGVPGAREHRRPEPVAALHDEAGVERVALCLGLCEPGAQPFLAVWTAPSLGQLRMPCEVRVDLGRL